MFYYLTRPKVMAILADMGVHSALVEKLQLPKLSEMNCIMLEVTALALCKSKVDHSMQRPQTKMCAKCDQTYGFSALYDK